MALVGFPLLLAIRQRPGRLSPLGGIRLPRSGFIRQAGEGGGSSSRPIGLRFEEVAFSGCPGSGAKPKALQRVARVEGAFLHIAPGGSLGVGASLAKGSGFLLWHHRAAAVRRFRMSAKSSLGAWAFSRIIEPQRKTLKPSAASPAALSPHAVSPSASGKR